MKSSMTIAEVLRAAKAKIEDPEHWCKYSYACDADGNSIASSDPEAQSWCGMGAVFSLSSLGPKRHAISCLQKAALEHEHVSIDVLNDHSGHESVMKMYDRAIEFAEEDEHVG